MEWFRFYTRTLDCRKVQGLDAPLFKAWANLLCIASIHDGVLPEVSEIAFRLRCSESEVKAAIQDLKERNLIDSNASGDVMHDWNQHQYVSDNSTKRVKKHREKQARNVSVTPPEQNRTDTETDAERTEKPFAPSGADAGVVRSAVPARSKPRTLDEVRRSLGVRLPWFEHLCSVHPAGKESVKAAAEAFARKVTPDESGRSLALEMYHGAKAYAQRCAADPTAKVKYMQGWINDERWRDALTVAQPVLMPIPTASERRRAEVIHGLNVIDQIKGRA